jgi:hypothetical protein
VTRRRRDEVGSDADRRARGNEGLRQHPWPGKRALTDALGRPAPRDQISIPGKRALTDGMSRRAQVDGGQAALPVLGQAVQRKANGAGPAAVDPRLVAAEGTQGPGEPLPHLDVIQRAFGRHDVSGIQAQIGGDAVDACDALGAEAFATGTRVAFRAAPTLHTTAHEAAHVVQQRAGVSLSGRLGADGDAYERHADAVAEAVVRGETAEGLLDAFARPGAGASNAAAVQLRRGGASAARRAALEVIITTNDDPERVERAFGTYWSVTVREEAGASQWDVATLRRIHEQLKRLPEPHVRRVWRKLVRTKDNTGGGWSRSQRTIFLGEDALGDAAKPKKWVMGIGTLLARAARLGDTTIFVSDPRGFTEGDEVLVAPRTPAQEAVRIREVTDEGYVLEGPLLADHKAATLVGPEGDASIHKTVWLDHAVRHELGHAVETALGGVKGFTAGLAGWWAGTDFDRWAAAMGTPWVTSDGAEVPMEDQRDIKRHILARLHAGGERKPIESDLATDHAVVRYLDQAVPVIEAARPCIAGGENHWAEAQNLKQYGSRTFTMNFHYKQLQYLNTDAFVSRVSDFALYAPGEFFAETYSVYYEDAGLVPEGQLGKKVPVAAWRDWITAHVHRPGMPRPGGAGVGRSGGRAEL